MTYVINNYDGSSLMEIADGSASSNLDITLVGRNFPSYGSVLNENFLYLLQNFAKTTSPSRPVIGQLWFDKTENRLKVLNINSSWSPIGTPTFSSTQPTDLAIGGFWYDTSNEKLYVYDGSTYKYIGPEIAPGFGITRFESNVVIDSTAVSRPVIYGYVNDEIILIISNAEYVLNGVTGFSIIKKGINLSTTATFNANISGIVEFANKLATPRKINNIPFDGSADITIHNSALTPGNFITGVAYDGSSQVSWGVNATSDNVVNTVVSRDSTGSFSAVNVQANFFGKLTGNVTGNVTGSLIATDSTVVFSATTKQFTGSFLGNLTGNVTGTASTATKSININGGIANSIVYQTSPSVTSFITPPQYINTALMWNGTAFTWLNPTSLPSDYRLKTVIGKMESSVDRLMKLNPLRYVWKESNSVEVEGFLAHEVATVIPAAVCGEKDAIAEDGSIDVQTLDQTKMIPLLVSALQEAIERITVLEAKLADKY